MPPICHQVRARNRQEHYKLTYRAKQRAVGQGIRDKRRENAESLNRYIFYSVLRSTDGG